MTLKLSFNNFKIVSCKYFEITKPLKELKLVGAIIIVLNFFFVTLIFLKDNLILDNYKNIILQVYFSYFLNSFEYWVTFFDGNIIHRIFLVFFFKLYSTVFPTSGVSYIS